jgi:FHA domain
MNGRQVEVVPGSHLVATKAGAAIVVAHRDKSPLTKGCRAAQTWAALSDLIAKAIDLEGHQFGRAFARLAAKWVVGQDDVEFGVLSPDEAGLAVFLHGDVVAVVDYGNKPEMLHGTHAATFVDMLRPVKNRAGLYVGQSLPVPALPAERGVSSLVEGVAPGSGVFLWMAEDPSEPSSPPTTPRSERPRPDLTPAEANAGAVIGGDVFVPPPVEHVELKSPKVFDTFTKDENPPPRRDPLPVGPQPAGRPNGRAHRKQGADGNRILGVKCLKGHLNDPRVAFCRVCGYRMDHTKAVVQGDRPALGVLILDDGRGFVLQGDCIFGREPQDQAGRKGSTPIRLFDRSGKMSRAHAEFRLIEWDVAVVDLGSLNGTRVRVPGKPGWQRLAPQQPFLLVPGAEVSIGERTLIFDSPHARL